MAPRPTLEYSFSGVMGERRCHRRDARLCVLVWVLIFLKEILKGSLYSRQGTQHLLNRLNILHLEP